MLPGLHSELHRQVLAAITRALASSSLHGQLVLSKVSYRGHCSGSNQRAPSGVKQPCWNMERWFFFLVLTKWQSHQCHCMCQLRQEYLPGKCLFGIFFQSQNGWVHVRHAWTHLYRISPIWAIINIPASQAVARGTGRPEGPATSYEQKCQAAFWKRLSTTRVQSRTSPFLRELTNEVPVSVAPGTTPTYSHTFSCANRCTTQFRRNVSEPWKEVLTLRRLIIFHPEELLFPYNLSFKPLVSVWTGFQEKLTWYWKASPV